MNMTIMINLNNFLRKLLIINNLLGIYFIKHNKALLYKNFKIKQLNKIIISIKFIN